MSDTTASQTPLRDLLRAVPTEAHGWWEENHISHRHIPYGRLCNEAAVEIDRLQAQIDRLMLEYCPDEMTTAQLSEWARNQRAVEPGEKA